MKNAILDITESVECFREIIISSWESLKRLSEKDTTKSFIDDWLQSNWERIVESSIDPNIGIILPPYGEGADCNVSSSRVWKPSALENSHLKLSYVGNDELLNAIDGTTVEGDLSLDHFCSMENGWPILSLPFDHLVLDRVDMVVIPARDLRYFVVTNGTSN